MHDLLIRQGSVRDASGSRRRTADVATDGGRISEIGPRSGAPGETPVSARWARF
jgi:N-acyl-D-aspartate/D-glutamate deacylase